MADFMMKDSNALYNLIFLVTKADRFDRTDELYWRTVFHMMALFHHGYVGLFSMNLKTELQQCELKEVKNMVQFRLAYLTGWSFAFQTVFLMLAVMHDLLEWLNIESKFTKGLRYSRDILFTSLVFPMTTFVTPMFWSLFAIDRELVYPAVVDEVVPFWFNHCVHTNIMVILVLEVLLQPRRYPLNRKLESIMCVGCSVFYAIVYYSVFYFGGVWLYKVFGVMTWWQVCLFQCFIWSYNYTMYRLQYPINRLIHGDNDNTINDDEPTRNVKVIGDDNVESYKIDDLKKVGHENGVDVVLNECNKVPKHTVIDYSDVNVVVDKSVL